MAKGDVRSYRGRGGGMGGGSWYDDEGRGASKELWKWFKAAWMLAEYSREWLFNLEDKDYYRLVDDSTTRYNLLDICHLWATKEEEERIGRKTDSRARRLVEKKHDEDTWYRFHTAMVEGYERHLAEMERRNREFRNKYLEDRQKAAEEREAQRVVVLQEDREHIAQEVELTAGALRSDVHQAVSMKEIYDRDEGEWIDDPVTAYQTGYGFGDEIKERGGIKLQVTVSLDLSNSMWYNNIALAAANAFREIGMSLLQLEEEHQGDLFVEFFTFSQDSWEKRGRKAGKLNPAHRIHGFGVTDEEREAFGRFVQYRPSALKDDWGVRCMFDGEDTWITPLFEEIEKWEDKESDPTAARLDLIITDAVLEHPTDIRVVDDIQTRRDGNLQTVMLNFMPEEDWLGSTLPLRCVQYPANSDNISGMLRTVLTHFLAVYL